MKKYTAFLSYKIQNQIFNLNFCENINEKDFSLQIILTENSIKAILIPKNQIELLQFYIVLENNFSKTDKIFVNGFQSWTDSKEFSYNQKMKTISNFAKLFNSIYKFKQYGDYSFAPKVKRSDFYGFAFAYIKNKDDYRFFVSENEEKFHTIFYFSFQNNEIKIITECENVKLNEQINLLDVKILSGEQKIIYEYFQKIKSKDYQSVIGWTSWYNYYQNISDNIILDNLESFKNIFPEKSFFQIDDGFQTKVGDWLDIDKQKFPNGLVPIVEKIHSYNYNAGLWLAPFSAQKDSYLADNHSDWILKNEKGEKIFGGINWGGFYALNFYNSDFRDYLASVFDKVLNDWAFDLVKLDFLYSVAIIPQQGKSRAEIMTEALNFLRKLVGNKKILACGVPLAQAYNKVDFCRIGTDISLDWNGKFYEKLIHRERVSTYNSLKNSIYRSYLDKNVFTNDPDVFLLRNDNIKLTKNQKITIFLINTIFGNLVFTSDNISEYSEWQTQLINNLQFFLSAKVNWFTEDNDLFQYHFSIENKHFFGFTNLSENNIKISSPNSKLWDIFTLQKIEDTNKNIINKYETKIYER